MKIINTHSSRTIRTYLGMSALTGFIALGLVSNAYAYVIINSQLDLGETNADVTSLQQFLAASPELYPSGLVTGYYGSLTAAAVSRFQVKYGLAQVGRVGPLTRDKINSLITNSGGVTTVTGVNPAIVMQTAPQVAATTATFNWMTTNEAALGRVYYSTVPLMMNEGDINSSGFAITSGTAGSYDSVARTNQSSTLTGLMPNTVYYYTIVATDLSGNVSLIGPNNSFRTSSQ